MPRIIEILAKTLEDTELDALERINRGGQLTDIAKVHAKTLVDLRAAKYETFHDGMRLVLTRFGARLLFECLAHKTQAHSRHAA